MGYILICSVPWDTEEEYRYDINVAVTEEKIKGIKKVLVPFDKNRVVTMAVIRRIVMYDNGKVREI